MKKSLTLSSVNLLYLVIMVMTIAADLLLQSLKFSLGLILPEFLFILLPTVIFLLVKKVPFKEGLRLNRIRPSVAVLCLLMGISINFFSMLINLIMVKITGDASLSFPESMLPHGLIPSILFFVAVAIAAPICEESLFRGVIQQAYETRESTFFAIGLPALMFVALHFRLTTLPGLLPVAFLLGYVAWRSRSIIGTMLIHLGVNSFSAIFTLISLGRGIKADQTAQAVKLVQSSPPALITGITCLSVFGLITAGAFLLAFSKMQPPPLPLEKPAEPRYKWLAVYWPLVVSFIIFVGVSGISLVFKSH
jgi:membrane protease YdiL (CAAX protease family)